MTCIRQLADPMIPILTHFIRLLYGRVVWVENAFGSAARPGRRTLATLLFTCISIYPVAVAAQTDLAARFQSPPDTARPGVYWYFMDGNLSRAGMTADLESMKEAGLGNLIFLEVNVGIPRGTVDFLSDSWQELFVHAVREAERLGIEIVLGSGPGWAGSGGPWVTPEQSMQHLVAASVALEGPTDFRGVLPRPEPREPYFAGAVTGALIEQRQAFYEDVAVLAFPTPVGKHRIPDSDEKALYYRAPYTSRPGVKPYLPAPAEYPSLPPETAIAQQMILDLTEQLQPDGRLHWDVPAGNWTIMRFGRCNNGATTRPAPRPGLGFECDKLDPTAFDVHFAAYAGKLLRKVGRREPGRGWTMMHIDSWEMGAQNWTAKFREEFQCRRGYDLLPFLPAYTGWIVGSLEQSERFLWDVRLTVQDLILENHVGRLKQLAQQHGMKLSIEPYDMNPTSDLELGAVADVPMCEFWSEGFGFDSSFSCFEATSIAHTLGRPVVAAEAFTAASGEAWKLYPAAMKNQGDWAFCTGINRLVYHTFAHKPYGRRPGMTMGPYGVHWDRGQTWWPMVAAYHRYITRCQFLLREGRPVADICYLVPEGAPHVFRPPLSALQGTGSIRDRRGYNFDGCSPNTLLARASVVNGRIVFPGGAAYRILVIPAIDTMTPALLRKITQLVQQGATVVGPPPRKSPSLMNFPQCDEQVASRAAELWGRLEPSADIIEREYGRGRVLWGGDLQVGGIPDTGPATNHQPHGTSDPEHNLGSAAEEHDSGAGHPSQPVDANGPEFPDLYPDYEATARLLAKDGLPPDFESDGPIRYTHRRSEKIDIYFIANRAAEKVAAICTFRVAGQQPELWDPLTGAIRDLPEFTEQGGRIHIPLHFEPHQSFFLVFRNNVRGRHPEPKVVKNFPEMQLVCQIDGAWDIAFDPNLGGPDQVTLNKLQDWSQQPEPGIKYYSGIATYRKMFTLPESAMLNHRPIWLDLGVVHSMARVRLNGHDLGVVWCAPWRIDITDAVKAKDNRLEIEVANLWPNRLIGDKLLPPDQQVAWTTFNPYQPNSPLLPSGLLGPVRILSALDRQ